MQYKLLQYLTHTVSQVTLMVQKFSMSAVRDFENKAGDIVGCHCHTGISKLYFQKCPHHFHDFYKHIVI